MTFRPYEVYFLWVLRLQRPACISLWTYQYLRKLIISCRSALRDFSTCSVDRVLSLHNCPFYRLWVIYGPDKWTENVAKNAPAYNGPTLMGLFLAISLSSLWFCQFNSLVLIEISQLDFVHTFIVCRESPTRVHKKYLNLTTLSYTLK